MDAPRTAAPGIGAGARGLRNPLATARPGLDYLRAAFLATWQQGGSLRAGPLALGYVQAVAGTPEASSDLAAIARWISERYARSPERHPIAN